MAAQAGSTTPATEAQRNYSGSALFKDYCGSCHGVAAKGDGPLADQLRFRPADLTLLARRNKGKWDGEKVRRSIDGRDPVKGHGGTDMPVWGDAFKASRDGSTEEAVKEKIQALVEHIQSIQASPEHGPADAGKP
jgi:mono/diheme cytochrome c family protein